MLRVRKAIESDLPKVVELSEMWAAESITHGLAANSLEMLGALLGDYFWVAEVEGMLVGYIFGSVHESDGMAVLAKGERYLEIDEVYVHPNYRSDNVGHRMVDLLLQTAESNGITRSIVYSATKQWQRIVGFYEKHGFQMWFVQMYR